MRASIKASTISRISGAVAAVWACCGGPAWAGDADLGSLQTIIGDAAGTTGLCHMFGMTNNNCPQLPNITQAVLEVVALGNNLPEMVRAQTSIAPQFSVDAGNPAANIPIAFDPNTGAPIYGLPLATTTPSTSDVLATLTPLAFISQSSGAGQAAQPYDSSADTFLYAVGVTTQNTPGDPDTVYFFIDDLSRTGQNFNKGQIVTKFSLPLTKLKGDSTKTPVVFTGETTVMTTLQVMATCNGGCLQAQVISGFGATPSTPSTWIPASQFGIQFALVFSASPTSPQKHAILEWAVPLLVTGAHGGAPGNPNTDPAYFYTLLTTNPNPENKLVPTAFQFDVPLLPPNFNPPSVGSIGLAPSAGPLLPGTPACTLFPPDPLNNTPAYYSCTNGPMTYAVCASLPSNANGQPLRPAVATFYAVATSGETWLSAPFHPSLQGPPGSPAAGQPAFVCP
jgi:hypothetical protein